MLTLIFAAILPIQEMQTVDAVAREYALTRAQKALLVAIRRTENGKAGLEFGIAQHQPNHPARRFKDGKKSFLIQARWCAGTIKRRFNGDVAQFSRRYCPENHKAWTRMVLHFMEAMLAKRGMTSST